MSGSSGLSSRNEAGHLNITQVTPFLVRKILEATVIRKAGSFHQDGLCDPEPEPRRPADSKVMNRPSSKKNQIQGC